MDVEKSALLCRLCGVKITEGKCKYIFEEGTDLADKIKETLPITITADDQGSKHVCFQCYNQVILHYKFVQEVLEHAKESDNTSQFKPTLHLSKEVTDFSNIHSDAVYTCPNCNVDLMILLVSNPQGCEYSFQITLAVVGHSDKNHITKDRTLHKNVARVGNNRQHDANIKGTKPTTNDENIEKIGNQVSLDLPELQQENGTENVDLSFIKENSILWMQKKKKRKLNEINSIDCSLNALKSPKLEEITYESDTDLSNGNYVSVETVIKLEPGANNDSWLNSEIDCKGERNFYVTESEDIALEKELLIENENDLKSDDNAAAIWKNCPKIVCQLCGARYVSQLKYAFHMERHELSKMDKYECTLCEKEASSENLLWDHYYHTHKSLKRFACTECGKLFAKRNRLRGHQNSHKHSGVKEIEIDGDNEDANTASGQDTVATEILERVAVNCNLCGKLISDLDPDGINDLVTCANCEDSTLSLMVDGNETKVISPRQYHCSKCSKHFVRKERLEFHEMRHNENMNEFICSTCGKEFSAENSLYEHYLFVHKGARPHICELCGKSFQLKARLKEHHRTHTGERPFECDVCGQKCRTTNALRLHRKIHFSHNRYTCNVCNKTFSKKQNMNEHLEKHWIHDKNVSLPQLFTCPICTEDFPTYRMLKNHMIEVHEISNQDPILTSQKPWYECGECHEKFKHQMSLKAHKEKVHEGRVNPIFQCDMCNATYRVKQLLINHITSKHNGEKRYKCAQCEKGFNDTKSMYNHILLHTGKKPFVCEYCNMSFRRKDSRDHHRRKHTGEQPYQCPDCGESFSTYNNRSKHRKRKHGVGESECPECGEKCSGQQEIRIHLNKHLGEKLKKLQTTEVL